MSKQVRIHLEKAILVGSLDDQRYAKVLVGEHELVADTVQGRLVFQTFAICGYVFSYQYHKLPAPTLYSLAESNILAVSDYPDVPVGYAERNAHEFLARQLFAVPDSTPVSRQQYDDAKRVSLGLAYNMSEADLAALLKRPVAQVEAILDRYLSFLGIDRAGPWQYPVKPCGKQFAHGKHNYRKPVMNTTCLGQDY